MNDLVSVIIPSYKGEDKICRAVDSVLAQTYENIEIFVVDDNGKGTEHQIKTSEVMQKYKCNKNVNYLVHEVNKNGAAARNTAIRVAKGDFLCFLDDDDVFLPEKVKLQVNLFNTLSDDYGIVFGAVKEYISESNIKIHNSQFKEEEFLYRFLIDDVNACSSTVMIRASVMNVVEEWDESFHRHQDWEFFARVADSFKAAYISECCVEKYKYDNNLPKDGKIVEEYRQKYLDKIKYIIEKLPQKQQQAIYNHHYTDVGKVYIKNHNLKDAIRMAKKTSSFCITIYNYLIDGLRYIISR